MAQAIPHRELRNNSGEVLRRVAAGEHFEVTNHGEVVALLVPPADAPGLVRPSVRAATAAGFAALPRVRASATTAEALDALRDER